MRLDGCTHLGVVLIVGVKLEKHEVWMLPGTWRPLSAVTAFTVFRLAVRITVFGEVGPCREHPLREVPVALCPRSPAVLEGFEHEPEVGRVERTFQAVGDFM